MVLIFKCMFVINGQHWEAVYATASPEKPVHNVISSKLPIFRKKRALFPSLLDSHLRNFSMGIFHSLKLCMPAVPT